MRLTRARAPDRWAAPVLLALALCGPIVLLLGPTLGHIPDPRTGLSRGLLLLAAGAFAVSWRQHGHHHQVAAVVAGCTGVALLVAAPVALGVPVAADPGARQLLAGVVSLPAVLALVLLTRPARGRSPLEVIGPTAAVLAIIATTFTAVAGLGVALRSAGYELRLDTPTGDLVATVATDLVFLVAVLAFARPAGLWGWRALGYRPVAPARLLQVGSLMAALGLLAEVTVDVGLRQFGIDTDALGNLIFMPASESPSAVAQAVLSNSLVAPTAEELLFRGLLLGLLLRSGQPAWLAVLLSSALFGTAHLAAGMPPLQLVVLAGVLSVDGALLAIAYRWTGSLLPGMLAHGLINLAPTLGGELGLRAAGGQVAALIVTGGTAAVLLLLAQRPRAPAGRLGRRLAWPGLVLRVGRLQVRPVAAGGLLAGIWLCLLALSPAEAGPLLTAVAWGALEGPAAVAAGCRWLVGHRLGARVDSVTLGPSVVVAFDGLQPRSPGWRRATVAAGLGAWAFGVLVVGLTLVVGSGWAPSIQQVVLFIGGVYAVSLVTLLPVAGLDGQHVWPGRWQVRSRWPAPVLLILMGGTPAVLVTARFPDGLFASVAQALSQPAELGGITLVVLAMVAVLRRLAPQAEADVPG